MSGLFVSGTDTGVGKTLVTAAIARQWRREGRSFRVCKPVVTGATRHQDRLLGEDTLSLAQAAGEADLEAITPWTFMIPAAPPVAARAAGVRLELSGLVEAVRQRSRAGSVLVEGVGGLLCPLTESALVADWIAKLALPVLIVARRSLGTLNHTLLTLEVAKQRCLRVIGVVVNETTRPASLAEQTNVEELRRWIDVPIRAVVPYQEGEPRTEIPAISDVDWWSLIR